MDDTNLPTEDELRERLTPDAVRGHPEGRHRAGVHRRVLGLPRPRHLPLHRLRRAAVQLRHQVRLRHGLAELLGADRPREGQAASRTAPTAWSAPRCAAPAATPTSATCSPTARNPTGERYCMNSASLKLEKADGDPVDHT